MQYSSAELLNLTFKIFIVLGLTYKYVLWEPLGSWLHCLVYWLLYYLLAIHEFGKHVFDVDIQGIHKMF